MKTVLIIIGVTVLILIIKACMPGTKPKPDTDTTRPSDKHLPKQEKQNEKLVLVDNISRTEIDSILTGFCNIYNKESFQAQPRLYKLSEIQICLYS